ncbi:MAG: DEAD/DEAH box helicase family protein [Chloroflexi bacterium]|nr:DEAD/DEAH box helicase family protein [Chloroflexota bacterium]
MNQPHISLDLETTGLQKDKDAIIEIAAVKFQGEQILDIHHSLVNPQQLLPHFVQHLTGLSQRELDEAPPLETLKRELISFIGQCPLIGHNIPFDLDFLNQNGLFLANPTYDTCELASILLPQLADYSLVTVAAHLNISHPNPHRALPDAMTARQVFLGLLERMRIFPPLLRAEMASVASRGVWPLHRLFRGLEEEQALASPPLALPVDSLETLVAEEKEEAPRLRHFTKLIEVAKLTSFLQPEGPLATTLPNFEERPQQVQMAKAVAQAFNDGHHLMVEAGTGTGKSLAYLLPALFFALENDTSVVISTNTINLQEQLLSKDIPDLLRALEATLGPLPARYALLKGRDNYLCRRRWNLWRKDSDDMSPAEIKTMLRILVWLSSTTSGDRAELNLNNEETAFWQRVCSQADNCLAERCPHQRQGSCFLYRARRRAQAAHLVIVNHALLLSDAASHNQILPSYGHLVIDEAHHLEEKATSQFGFRITQRELADPLNRLSAEGTGQPRQGLLHNISNHFRGSLADSVAQRRIEELAADLRQEIYAAQDYLKQFFNAVSLFLRHHGQEAGDYEPRLRLSSSQRHQPAWLDVEKAWESLSLALVAIEDALGRLHSSLEVLADTRILDYDDLMAELSSLLFRLGELRHQLEAIISAPESETVYWITGDGQRSPLSLWAAPLEVGGLLVKNLFGDKDSVILTSATLSTEGSFRYIKNRLGLETADDLLLTSPFDYLGSALIYMAQDIPEPDKNGYQKAIERTLADLCRTTQGRTLVLFTSYAALRTTSAALRSPLEAENILVLSQRIDGSANSLLTAFKANPRAVLLGTSSLWEGIDVVGEALSVLVIVRLPFNVPNEPVFAARSELYEDPFQEYALPQAILRFKQGFGRLIRSRSDRGAIVILDRRLQSRSYGEAFLQSLPPCTIETGTSHALPSTVAGWLGG